MKKALKICLITVLVIAVIGGATCCGILFSNEQILYNAITNKNDELGDIYGKAYTKLSDNTYYDISITCSDNTNNSTNLKTYLDTGNTVVAKLTMKKNNNIEIYEYEGDDNNSILYCDDGTTKSRILNLKFDDFLKTAFNLCDDNIYNLDIVANNFTAFFNGKQFDKSKFLQFIDNTEPVFDIPNKNIGAKYSFTYTDENNASVFKVQTIVDKNHNFRDTVIIIQDTKINITINNVNTLSTLSKKTDDEAKEYSGYDISLYY